MFHTLDSKSHFANAEESFLNQLSDNLIGNFEARANVSLGSMEPRLFIEVQSQREVPLSDIAGELFLKKQSASDPKVRHVIDEIGFELSKGFIGGRLRERFANRIGNSPPQFDSGLLLDSGSLVDNLECVVSDSFQAGHIQSDKAKRIASLGIVESRRARNVGEVQLEAKRARFQ
jgi:hypothetical protein